MANFTDEELATVAERMRLVAGFKPTEKLDVIKLVSKFEHARDPDVKITFREASPGFMRGALAQAQPKIRKVHYSNGLLLGVASGDKDAAHVILEEIAHVVLKHDANVLNHAIGPDIKVKANFAIELMEEEAKKFVWFVQAPISEVYGIRDKSILINSFGMSESAADEYFQHILQTRHKLEKKARSLPVGVIDFLSPENRRKRASGLKLEAANENTAVAEKSLQSVTQKNQYSAFSHIPCNNCGMLSIVIQSGCQHCTNCGDENGCA